MELSQEDIKVSVICLAYNHSKYIRQCLDGFIMQKTNFKFEVLIHDDASTDDTANIIREYEEKYPDIIKPIYQTENQYSQGVKIGARFLYPKAKGKYFAFCEGDDYWTEPWKLQKQYDALETHSDCHMCVHTVQCIRENGELIDKQYPNKKYNLETEKFSDIEICRILFWNMDYPFQTSSYFIRKSIIATISLLCATDFSLTNGDMQILELAITQGSVYYINEKMSCYRVLSIGSWSATNSRDVQKKNVFRWRRIKSNNYFNQYTNQKYIKYIYKAIGGDLRSLGAESKDYVTIKQYRPILKYVYKNKEYARSYRFSIFLLYCSPRLFKLFFTIKQKLLHKKD